MTISVDEAVALASTHCFLTESLELRVARENSAVVEVEVRYGIREHNAFQLCLSSSPITPSTSLPSTHQQLRKEEQTHGNVVIDWHLYYTNNNR